VILFVTLKGVEGSAVAWQSSDGRYGTPAVGLPYLTLKYNVGGGGDE